MSARRCSVHAGAGESPLGLCRIALPVTREAPGYPVTSMPENLLDARGTRAGNWARVVVRERTLLYRLLEPEIEIVELSPEAPGIVEFGIAHHAEAKGRVRFCLESYR